MASKYKEALKRIEAILLASGEEIAPMIDEAKKRDTPSTDDGLSMGLVALQACSDIGAVIEEVFDK